MIKTLVWLLLLVNAGLGIGCLIDPVSMLAPIGVTPVNDAGLVELRAMYGGLEVGFALFLGWCLYKPELLRVGLLAATLEIGTMGLVRLVTWLMLQPDGMMLPMLILAEFGGGCLGTLVLWRSRGQDSQ